MRRVVSDQITALTALSDVVKRQSGIMEMSGPGVQHVPANGGAHGKAEAGPKAEAVQSAAPEPQGSGNGATVHGRSVEALAKASAERGTADLLPKLTAHAVGEGDETDPTRLARKTERLVAKLNAVARDLVHALDNSLDDELERRFAAGEQHVYTHRLYAGRRKLLSEIEVRYGEEPQLRSRADGFVKLFERLLDRVSEAPQGQELVDACLASESGKVYLMLAQASGRVLE
jgi:hypothetical protein